MTKFHRQKISGRIGQTSKKKHFFIQIVEFIYKLSIFLDLEHFLGSEKLPNFKIIFFRKVHIIFMSQKNFREKR